MRRKKQEDEQAVVFQFERETPHLRQAFVQCADELEGVLFPRHVLIRASRDNAEQVIDHRPRQIALPRRQILRLAFFAAWREGEHIRALLATEAHLIERALEQRVESGRKVKIEITNRGECADGRSGLGAGGA